ncbi:MAG: hypothetical protein AAB037_01060, partial [Chloroflexota bacterium]
MKWYGIFSALTAIVVTLSACGPVPQAPSATPPPPASSPIPEPVAATPVATPTTTPTLAPSLSSAEAIAVVQNFIRGEAQTTQARLELGKVYDYKWEATFKDDGIWEVKGVGVWRLFEKSKVVQPNDEVATRFLRTLALANIPPTTATQ